MYVYMCAVIELVQCFTFVICSVMSHELMMLLQQIFHYQIHQLQERKVWRQVSITSVPDIDVLLMLCS